MEQDQVSRREREKRRRKILAEQLEALRQQQEANRENLLVDRLMRQCVQEKRIATQLMQIRKEKEVIRNNRLVAVTVVPLVSCWERRESLACPCVPRIMRQKQFEEQRMAEFQRALEKEAVSCLRFLPVLCIFILFHTYVLCSFNHDHFFLCLIKSML